MSSFRTNCRGPILRAQEYRRRLRRLGTPLRDIVTEGRPPLPSATRHYGRSWGLHDPFGHRNARLGGRAPGQGLRAACGCLDRAAALINTLFERLYSNSAGTHFSYCPMQGENSSMRPPAGRPPCARGRARPRPAHRARRQIESQDAAPPAGCADGGSCGRT